MLTKILEFFVLKKRTDPNKITTLLLAALLLLQRRECCLVLSGEERAKLLMRELRSFLGCYSYEDALQVGLLPYMHYRLIVPCLEFAHLEHDIIAVGLPGTLKTNPHYKPRRANRAGKHLIIQP